MGEWLPEPLMTSPYLAADLELAESVSIAMLTVLETLAPARIYAIGNPHKLARLESATALTRNGPSHELSQQDGEGTNDTATSN